MNRKRGIKMLNKNMVNDIDSIVKSFEIEDIYFSDFEKDIFAKVTAGEMSLAEAKKIFLTHE
jgi:hypothetical protein